MDSTVYKYFASEIIKKNFEKCRMLPIQLISEEIVESDETLKASAFFLNQLVTGRKDPKAYQFPAPSLLSEIKNNNFTLLLLKMHGELAHIMSGLKNENEVNFKRNGSELLIFLCFAISQKSIPIFREGDTLSYAMCCFIIEACMYVGWCPNAFENVAKGASHFYFSQLKKNMYTVNDFEYPTILGYIQSAWICAQITEGIKDNLSKIQLKEVIQDFSWQFCLEERDIQIDYRMYFLTNPYVFQLIPKYKRRIPHPIKQLEFEGKIGLTLYSDTRSIIPEMLIESTPINRHKFKGMKFIYSCNVKNKMSLKWIVVLQIFKNTLYRLDVLIPEKEECEISGAELRLENSITLKKLNDTQYFGRSKENIVVELFKNPCGFIYIGQEEPGISLFRGKKIILSPKKSLQIVTAWAEGKDINDIDSTYLLGIFDIP